MAAHRVVIVGGGFGGLYAARPLGRDRRVSVTLIDRRNYHLFQPMLYQVATGALAPGDIAQPLRSILRRNQNTTVLLGEATGIEPDRREVLLSDGGPIAYDTLIVATGVRFSYFDHDDWVAFAPGLKSIDDAIEVRRRILIAFEAAEREHDRDRRAEWMTFVVVGGGPTGVELAGALGEIAHDTLRRDFRSIDPGDARILLVEAMDRILPTYPPGRITIRHPPARTARGQGPDEDPGRPRRRSVSAGGCRRDRGAHPDPNGPVGGRRPCLVVRPVGRHRGRGRDGSIRSGRRRPRPVDPRPS